MVLRMLSAFLRLNLHLFNVANLEFMASVTRRNTRYGAKRGNPSPTQDLPPQKSQNFKKVRSDSVLKKLSPMKDQMLWGARSAAYWQKYGRSFVTDSEGEMSASETSEAAKLFRNLKIPKEGSVEPEIQQPVGEQPSLLEKMAAAEKPKTTEQLFDVIMAAFTLTNKNILSDKTHLQTQVDTIASGVRTNTRAVLRGRKELMAVSDRVLDLERKNLANSILVYDHGMSPSMLKSWQEREKTILVLLREALGIREDMNYLFKIVCTEARLPRIQTPGMKPPPIKVFFPSTSAYDYLATVIQYPTRLREWHRDLKGKRGSLPKFSIKPNVTFTDRQRAQYARKVVDNIQAYGVPEGTRFEVTPYGGVRKTQDGQSRIIPFERMLDQYANFLPLETGDRPKQHTPEMESEGKEGEEMGEGPILHSQAAAQGAKFQQAEEEQEESYMSSEN